MVVFFAKAVSAKDGSQCDEPLEEDTVVNALRAACGGGNLFRLKKVANSVIKCELVAAAPADEVWQAVDALHLKVPLGSINGQECVLGIYPMKREHLKQQQDKAVLKEQPGFVSVQSCWSGQHACVQGLYLFPEFLDENQHEKLLGMLSEWEKPDHRIQPEKRRVKHYGYRFNYNTRRCDSEECESLPLWLADTLTRINPIMQSCCLNKDWVANQVTVNEYTPGQGIAPHVDTHSAFFDGIASLSLGASVTMRFQSHLGKQHHVLVPAKSLLVMSGPARFAFTHGIPQRKNDLIDDEVVARKGTRVSLTLRLIKTKAECLNCPCPEMCDIML